MKVRLRLLEAQFTKLLLVPYRVRKLLGDVLTGEADGISFLCPQCFKKNGGPVGTHTVICWFRGRVPDGESPGPGRWGVAGTSIDDLTLDPSIDLGRSCGWHGFVQGGEAS